MQQVEFVYQALALQEIQRAIDGDARYAWIYFLGALENFVGVEMAARCVHDLQEDAALAG